MPYFALTRESAKNIMWPILNEVNERYNIGATRTESNLTYTLPNGSKIQLFGGDMKNIIERNRGIKTPFAAIDEAQSFRVHLDALVDDILVPGIADYEDGQIALTGTPGIVKSGMFYEASQGKLGFKVHKWSILDNPYMPRARAFLADLRKRRGWTEDFPTYLREWLGQWVDDPDAKVYKFKPEKNLVTELPESRGWQYVLGVDLGYDPDPSAFCLLAYRLERPEVYVVETYKQTKMIVSDVAERIKWYQSRFENLKVVCDAGGQGKQIVEEIRQRYGLTILAAEKTGKSGFIEIMNSDFHLGAVKLLVGQTEELQDEYAVLCWDSESKERKEDGRYANHLADAALYAWRWCYTYVWAKDPEKTKRTEEEKIDEFWEREAERLRQEKELDFLER